MSAEVYPAILAHTFDEYVARVELVEGSIASWVHIDIMDGQFVPNITVMPSEIMSVSLRPKIEAHLMTYAPERYYSDLTVMGVDRILIHREIYDSLEECQKALKQASDYFAEVGIVLNPDTELEQYKGLNLQAVQVMGVNPGYSGQTMVDGIPQRIKDIIERSAGAVVAVDGGVNEENITSLQEAGARRFILASWLFAGNTISNKYNRITQLVTGGV